MTKTLNAVILSASSGIGEALCRSWAQLGWKIFGSYRKLSPSVADLPSHPKIQLAPCDLYSLNSISDFCSWIEKVCPAWDVFVCAAGTLDPVGPFEKTSFEDWESAIQVNFLRPLKVLQRLLKVRAPKTQEREPAVLFFAGGGTNNAVTNYSSYAISKIALTKMCEFLDAEIPDVRFSILGPGWVKTKIHESTLRAGVDKAGANFLKTQEKLAGTDWVPMERVVECCTWLVTTPSNGVKGRNFSAANDLCGSAKLERALEEDADMYKLRRNNNGWRPDADRENGVGIT